MSGPDSSPALARLAHTIGAASRQFRTGPAYSVIAILTMAIGIAAASAIFAVVRGVILRPLPYARPDALVAIDEYQPALRRDQTGMSFADYSDLRASSKRFEAFSAFSNSEYVLSDGANAERVIGAVVDADLFPLLGVRPRIGRVFAPAEAGQVAARVAVLAYPLWRRRYGGDTTLVGRAIVVDGERYTVIGVMPERFEFPRNAGMSRDIEIWTPRRSNPAMMMRRAMRSLTVVARLRRGVGLDAARAELATIGQRLAAENPRSNDGWAIRATPVRDVMIGPVRPTLLVMFAGVGALLLIVCANLSAAALARIVSRRHALGVRLALGASHGALAELLLGESIMLSSIAGVVAIPSSAMMRSGLIHIAPVAIPRQSGIGFDAVTLSLTAGVALIVGLLTGVGPALWLRRLDARSFLAEAGRTSAASPAMRRALGGFVIGQVAAGTILLGLTIRVYGTYSELNRIDPGFEAGGVTTASIALAGQRYESARERAAMTERLLARVRALPGVKRAAVGSLLPMSGGRMSSGFRVMGVDADSSTTAALRTVSSDFFQTLGIPLKTGRTIERADAEGAPRVAVVNQALVDAAFPTNGRAPIGSAIRVSAPGRDSAESFEIVGVVGNAKEKDLRAPATPIVYFSNLQTSFPHTVLVIQSDGRSAAPIVAVRTALHDIDPSLALDEVGGLTDKVRDTYALQIFLVLTLGMFAATGVALIMLGVYGSVSFVVSASMRAIGVRMALGATRWMILRGVVGRAMRLAAVGCAAGIVFLAVLPRVTSVLAADGRGSGLRDAALGALALLGLAALASLGPALRGSGSDPASVLRE